MPRRAEWGLGLTQGCPESHTQVPRETASMGHHGQTRSLPDGWRRWVRGTGATESSRQSPLPVKTPRNTHPTHMHHMLTYMYSTHITRESHAHTPCTRHTQSHIYIYTHHTRITHITHTYPHHMCITHESHTSHESHTLHIHTPHIYTHVTHTSHNTYTHHTHHM